MQAVPEELTSPLPRMLIVPLRVLSVFVGECERSRNGLSAHCLGPGRQTPPSKFRRGRETRLP